MIAIKKRVREHGGLPDENFWEIFKMTHFISASCAGEFCKICSLPATHKLGEEILPDDPHPERHNLIAYVCCSHYTMVMGPVAAENCLRDGVVVSRLPPEWLSFERIIRHMIREVLEKGRLDPLMQEKFAKWRDDIPQDVHEPQFTPKHIFPIIGAYWLHVLSEV